MFYVRSPQEEGQKLIGAALSILWMVCRYDLVIPYTMFWFYYINKYKN